MISRRHSLTRISLALLIALSACKASRRSENQLTVKNQSGQTISVVNVSLRGWKTRFENVAADATAKANFEVNGDDHFVVEGQLADGTMFSEKFGYVTNGMYGEHVVIAIGPSGKIKDGIQ